MEYDVIRMCAHGSSHYSKCTESHFWWHHHNPSTMTSFQRILALTSHLQNKQYNTVKDRPWRHQKVHWWRHLIMWWCHPVLATPRPNAWKKEPVYNVKSSSLVGVKPTGYDTRMKLQWNMSVNIFRRLPQNTVVCIEVGGAPYWVECWYRGPPIGYKVLLL